jgi:probable rRNA maturation factor
LECILQEALQNAVQSGEVSVAIVGDKQIREINRRYLCRDRITDVIAFTYSRAGGHLEGEIVLNADEAARRAEHAAHGAADELALYAVHGALHLLGYEDAEPGQRRQMHERALQVLASAGRSLDPKTLLED